MSLTPYVVEKTSHGERSMDIYSRLLVDRIIFIGTEINDQVANVVVAQLLFLKTENPSQPVKLYINSPGGNINAGLAILDTMQYTQNKDFQIHTYCIGQAVSMAALLLAGGTKGCRWALPNSRVMLHQPYGGIGGTSEDMAIQAKEILELKGITSKLMSKFTGQTVEQILKDSERDKYFSAEKALDYGIIDHIATVTEKSQEPKA